ncbi:hypothetical protein G7054_g8741 [Neopestalotiopsis clavispora]|nr:hypothetical protein G7054_g8741 [Neopestalotiopsis clavispora]
MDVHPPWGAFPAEQYLIVSIPSDAFSATLTIQRHWDASSLLPANDQRRDLIRAFLELDAIPKEWDATGRRSDSPVARVPTEEEINEILVPWRPLRWREAALHLWRDRDDHEIWLRTHYGEGSNEKFQEMRDIDEDYDPCFEEDERSWTVLDDADLFKGDWSVALDLLPELAGPPANADAYSDRLWCGYEDIEVLRQELRESIAARLRFGAQGDEAEQLKVEDVEAGYVGMDMQVNVVFTYLFVADAEAFETDSLRLLFLDAQGVVVRESRIKVEETWLMRNYWNASKFRETDIWSDRYRSDEPPCPHPGSLLGDRYKITGDKGRALYGLE